MKKKIFIACDTTNILKVKKIISQTKTSRQRIQRLGRTIRKSKGKIKPIIYTLYTTEEEYSSLYEEQFNNPHIEVEWMEIK